MSLPKYLLLLAAAIGGLLLAGCASKPEPKPTIVRIELVASKSANGDNFGRGAPVVVRYYLLQSTGAFDGADYFSLFERDETLLAGTRVVREELLLRPGERRPVELRPMGDARFLAVFVAFRDFNQTLWRATAPVPQNATSSFEIRVEQSSVAIVDKTR